MNRVIEKEKKKMTMCPTQKEHETLKEKSTCTQWQRPQAMLNQQLSFR